MLCNHCGAQNADTVAYCQQCGSPMQTTKEAQSHTSTPPLPTGASSTSETGQRKNRGYVVAAVGAVVALIAYHALPFVSSYMDYSSIAGTFYNPVATTAENFNSFTDFSALLTFITLIVATFLFLMDKPSATAKTPIVIPRRRRAIGAMIGMSLLGILTYILAITSGGGSFDSIDAGFWIYLLGLGIVIVGSIMALSKLSLSLPTQANQ